MGPRSRFNRYESMVHPYSGLDPESWKRYLDNLRAFEGLVDSDIDRAANSLYSAVENIRDISLGIRRTDDGPIQAELNAIANRLAYEGEFIINQKANSRGLQFFSKYLNETIDDYPEDVPTGIVSTVRSHGQ